MYVFLSILIFLASIFLILIVLVQNSKGGGLASGFSSSNQIMGVRKTTDFLEKATWGLAGGVAVLSVVIASFIPKGDNQQKSQQESEIQQQVNDAVPVDPNAVGPDFGSQQQPQQSAEQQPAEQQPAQQQQEAPAK
jgi:preprotein translocase, secG subunit